MNENRFFLWMKILIKIKTRDKKKFTKKFHGGQFSGGQFSLGGIFRGQFSRGIFSGGIFPKLKIILHGIIYKIRSKDILGVHLTD